MKFINENNSEIFFSDEEFRSRSANVLEQGQYIMDAFNAKSEGLPFISVKLSTLKPIAKSINSSDVYLRIARDLEEVMVITNDNYVISDNLELAAQFSIWGFTSSKIVNAYLTRKTLDEILNPVEEGYGMQAPSAVPGMGAVELPTSTSTGSGDIPAVIDLDDEENNEVLEQKALEIHFESFEDIKDFGECINIPVKRKFKQIDTPFSCKTLEGITHGKVGDYVVIGVDNEIYPCDAEIFERTYMKIDPTSDK